MFQITYSTISISKLTAITLIIIAFTLPSSPSAASDHLYTGKRVLVLGDSISAGYGIPQGQGWVSLLQIKFDQINIPVKVINDSISGDTTSGGLARLPKTLKDTKPDWVIIALGGNDGLRGQPMSIIKENLIQMIHLCKKQGATPFLLGMKLPPNYGQQYTQQFEQIFREVSKSTKTPLLPFFIEGVGGNHKYMQEDRIHPNVEAQKLITNNVWEFIMPFIIPDKSA